MAAAASVPVVEAQHHHTAELVQIASVYQPKVLTAAEMQWFAKLSDAIIPRTDTPGAADAGVPAFIDRRLRGNAKMAEYLRAGMAHINAESRSRFGGAFDTLDSGHVTELLTAVGAAPESEAGQFFQTVKDLTIEGYYSSQEGLVKELGWHGNTFLPEFPGCTHPEHQG